MKSWFHIIKRTIYTALAGIVIIFTYVFYLSIDLPSIEQLENYDYIFSCNQFYKNILLKDIKAEDLM